MLVDEQLNGPIVSYNPDGTVHTVLEDYATPTSPGDDPLPLRTKTYEYSPTDGRLECVTADNGLASRRIAYGYFPNGQLRGLGVGSCSLATAGASKIYSYDPLQNVEVIEEVSGGMLTTTTLLHDELGRLVADATDGARSWSHTLGWYANGQLESIDDTTYIRDPSNGLLATIRSPGQPDLHFAYNAHGQLARKWTGAGLDLTYEYYDSGRLERIRGTAIGSSEGSLTLAYDDDGNAKDVEVSTSTGDVIAGNAFDLADRLISSNGTAGDYSYQFDAASNVSWLLADNPLASREETRLFDNANDAATIERTVIVDGAPTTETLSPRYDEIGNLISDGQNKSYVYDDFGRLSEVWIAGELVDRLSYDAAGRLAEDLHGPTGQTRTVETAGLLPVAFSGPAGARRIVPNPDTGMALAIIDPSGVEPYEVPTSALGVTRLLSTDTGAVTDVPVRSPYGEMLSGDPSAYPFGFKGYYEHLGGGIHTAYARSYDAELQYFLSPDPLAGSPFDPPTMNRRQSFAGDPIGMTDALGLYVSVTTGDPGGSGGGAGGAILAAIVAGIAAEVFGDEGSSGSSGGSGGTTGYDGVTYPSGGGYPTTTYRHPTATSPGGPPLPTVVALPGQGVPSVGPSPGGGPEAAGPGRRQELVAVVVARSPATAVERLNQQLALGHGPRGESALEEARRTGRRIVASNRPVAPPPEPLPAETSIGAEELVEQIREMQTRPVGPVVRPGPFGYGPPGTLALSAIAAGPPNAMAGAFAGAAEGVEAIDPHGETSISLYQAAQGTPIPHDDVAAAGLVAVSRLGRWLGRLGCFVSGTPVVAEAGLVSIEDVEQGDLVWSFDEETGEIALREVVAVSAREADSVVHVYIEGEEIRTTTEHPFWVKGVGWLPARDLVVGDQLWRLDSGLSEVQDVVVEPKKTLVFNLEVEGSGTYFVAEREVLVHNSWLRRVFSLGRAQGAAPGATSLASRLPFNAQMGIHSAERMAGRGVTQKMVDMALRRGQTFWDPGNKTIQFIVRPTSGKNFSVSLNPATRLITTTQRQTKSLVRPRFIEMTREAVEELLR